MTDEQEGIMQLESEFDLIHSGMVNENQPERYLHNWLNGLIDYLPKWTTTHKDGTSTAFSREFLLGVIEQFVKIKKEEQCSLN